MAEHVDVAAAELTVDGHNAEQSAVSAEQTKTFASKLLALLPKIMPILALIGAGLAFVFTFLIGVTSSHEGLPNYFIYHFFDGKYIDSISQIQITSWHNANHTVWVAGMVITIIGIIAVATFAGLTVYKAISKYVFKKDCSVELFSLLTFLSYVAFSSLFYAVNCITVETAGVTARTGYNAATIAGITVTCVIFFAYYSLKAVINRAYFKQKLNLIKFFYTVLRIAFIVVVMSLVTAPLVSVTSGGNVKSSFIQLLIYGTQGGNLDKLSSLSSSAVMGILLISVIVALSVWLLADNLSVLFAKKKNDTVFYIIWFVLLLFLLIVASVAGGFYADILTGFMTANVSYDSDIQKIDYIRTAGGFNIVVALVNLDGGDIAQELGSVNIAVSIPWVLSALTLAAVILTAAYPAVLTRIENKTALTAKPQRVKKAVSEEKISEKAENAVETADEKGKAFLEVDGLSQHFVIGRDFFGRPTKTLKAVDNVTFKLEKGKTLGIVGESGCGKTTMGRTVLRLYDVTSGEVWFKGRKISALTNREFDKLRPEMQMIFQDPYASLSPRLTVGEIIGEAALRHKIVDKAHYKEYILEVMKMCGLQPHYFERYPHEFSGGQRQRICIARALALKPELVICDEPVSALDVSIQAQIINMLIELRKTLGLTYVFISHDLSVVKHISDQVGVMYLGSMVEYGSKRDIFDNTLHPYTKALFSAVPVPDPHVKMNRIILKGDIPSPVNPPKGCKFHTRCESCMEICGRIAPVYKEVEEGHFCACHLYNTEEDVKLLEEKYEEEQRLAEELAAEQEKKNFFEALKTKIKKIGKKKKAEESLNEAGAAEEVKEADDVPKE